jgi:CRISPR-associated protein Cmr4
MADYRQHRYLLMTLDPVHIGTGGYRLGRVDNSIVREPGTRLPKIPGTSLSGAIRQYAAMQYADAINDSAKINCAGQKDHCGDRKCAICYTFGYVKGNGDDQQAHSGVVNIFDAQLVLFPVHSMVGPVWATTWDRLREAGFILPVNYPEPASDGALFTWNRGDPLNLGWLMLDGHSATGPDAPPEWQELRWQAVKERLVILPENLFGQVVNSNLEVRTSVSINPQTGAAESGALFTYEAIPRSAFLMLDVIQDDYKEEFPASNSWNRPLDVVHAGLKLAEWLGVGGMGTRGFGRLGTVGTPVEISFKEGNYEQ